MTMLSHDNQKEILRKYTGQRQHYAIKKLTVGVSSVLIGLSFLGVQAQNASADANAAPVVSTTQVESNENGNQGLTDSVSVAKNVTSANLVTVSNSATERAKLNQDLPAIYTNNPSDGSAVKTAGDHIIPGLANEAQYNLSVTARNGSTSGSQAGKTAGVYLPSGETTKHALVNYQTAQNLQINFELSNPTDQEMQISPVVYLNPYGPYHNVVDPSLLRFGDKGEIVDQNGQVINGLQLVFAFNGNKNYYTYDELVARGLAVGQADTFKVVGTLAAHTTAHVILPLTFDTANIGTYLTTHQSAANEIWLAGANDTGTIDLYLSTPLWRQTDVANDDILPMLKTAESLYQLLPAETTAQLLAALPKAGAVLVNVSNIGNVGGSANSSDPVLWMNGTYQLKLDQVQDVLRQFGYTVNLTPDGQNFVDHYTYNTQAMQGVQNADGNLDVKTNYGFYVEVHPVLLTRDIETQVGSKLISDWQPTDNIVAVNNLDYQGSGTTGDIFKLVPVAPSQVRVVGIANQDGQTVSTIDPTVPGTYTVSYEYYLNGNQNPAFRVTNTAQVRVTQATTPIVPVDPEIIDPNKVHNDDDHGGNDNSKPNGELIDGENGSNSQTGRGQLTGQGQSAGQATGVVSASRYSVPTASASQAQQQLPQTGNHSSMAVAGLGIASFLAMFGLARGKQH